MEALGTELVGGHGGELETSIHLYLQPDLVHMDRAVTDYGDSQSRGYPGYQPGRFSRDSTDPGFSETGILGDPTLANAEKGQRAMEILTEQWLLALQGFSKAATER
jgi:creatinine amidohydrolase